MPLFGWGLLLLVWVLIGGAGFAWAALRHGLKPAATALALPLLVAAAMLLWILPALDDGEGVPIRGYGVMLLVAAAAGTWLSVVRGRAVGFDADTILALGTEIFLWGLIGARLFYVLEYPGQFFRPGMSLGASLAAIANVAAGGLVVFGSLPTAALAAWRFGCRRGLSLAKLADCIAPGLLVGLAIGRVGCFLNGCCYGGPCELPWAVRFPDGTAPAAAPSRSNRGQPAAAPCAALRRRRRGHPRGTGPRIHAAGPPRRRGLRPGAHAPPDLADPPRGDPRRRAAGARHAAVDLAAGVARLARSRGGAVVVAVSAARPNGGWPPVLTNAAPSATLSAERRQRTDRRPTVRPPVRHR